MKSLSLLAASTAVAGPFAFSHETVRADGFFNNRPTLGVGADGTVYIAHQRQDNTADATKEIWVAERSPAGAWTHTQITNNAVREELPCLKVDGAEGEGGTMTVTWQFALQ